MYHIRPAILPDDAEAWLKLRMAVYEDDNREENLKEMEVYAEDDLRDCFLAVDDAGNVAGLLEMSLRSIVDGCLTSPVGYIEGIIVKEELRGQGPGAQALLAATDLLIDGRYEATLPDARRRWIGSTNQRMHALTDRYDPSAPSFFTADTVELRLVDGVLTANGRPWGRGLP